MIRRNVEKNRLIFTTDLKEGINGSEVIFIAVGTPPGEDGSADLRHVLEVAKEIGRINHQSYCGSNKKHCACRDIGKDP